MIQSLSVSTVKRQPILRFAFSATAMRFSAISTTRVRKVPPSLSNEVIATGRPARRAGARSMIHFAKPVNRGQWDQRLINAPKAFSTRDKRVPLVEEILAPLVVALAQQAH